MANEETSIDKLAEYAGKFFELRKLGEKEFWTIKNRHPVWIFDMVYKVHDNGKILPDDYKYQFIVNALNYISEGNDPEEPPQFEADPYTSDLVAWLASHRERLGMVDEAVENYGWDKERGIEGAIASGQVLEKEEVFNRVMDALKERLVDIENGKRETFRKSSGGVVRPMDWEPM